MIPALSPLPNANKTEMQNATANRLVTADQLKHSRNANKVFLRSTITAGVPAITQAENVTSITDHGVGAFTVVFTTAFANANYAMSGMAANGFIVQDQAAAAPVAGSCRVALVNSAMANADLAHFSFQAQGDQ